MNVLRQIQQVYRKLVGKERRKHPRYHDVRLELLIEDENYRTMDWSLGGFRLADFVGELDQNEAIKGQLRLSKLGGFEPFTADVIRRYDNSAYGFRFLDVSAQFYLALSKLSK